ncbi:MAG: hypothetical protein PHU63_01020, partial [Candidatus ainarchaeum sp.]|nr:hypothetical protein [Candidatus ainarchaeum sp.]
MTKQTQIPKVSVSPVDFDDLSKGYKVTIGDRTITLKPISDGTYPRAKVISDLGIRGHEHQDAIYQKVMSEIADLKVSFSEKFEMESVLAPSKKPRLGTPVKKAKKHTLTEERIQEIEQALSEGNLPASILSLSNGQTLPYSSVMTAEFQVVYNWLYRNGLIDGKEHTENALEVNGIRGRSTTLAVKKVQQMVNAFAAKDETFAAAVREVNAGLLQEKGYFKALAKRYQDKEKIREDSAFGLQTMRTLAAFVKAKQGTVEEKPPLLASAKPTPRVSLHAEDIEEEVIELEP